MIPVEQTCPKCGTRFMGSDIIGYPCFSCGIVEMAEEEKGAPLTEEETLVAIASNPPFDFGEI